MSRIFDTRGIFLQQTFEKMSCGGSITSQPRMASVPLPLERYTRDTAHNHTCVHYFLLLFFFFFQI